MATKEVAVVGAVLQYQTPVTGVAAQFTGTPSDKIKAEGKFAYLHNVQVTIPVGVTNGSCTTNVPGVGNMPATAVKVGKAGGAKVLRKDDSLTVNGIAGLTGGGNPCTLNVTVKISDAGQTSVKAN